MRVKTTERRVCLIERRGRFLVAEPFFERYGRRITIPKHERVRPGRLALVEFPSAGRGRVKVLQRLGSPDVAKDVLEALIYDRGLSRRFPASVERSLVHLEAEAPHGSGSEADGAGSYERTDLRDLATFTIDPKGAKDFDDAISARALGDGRFKLWVHIADVTAYVAPDSAIDREAYRRGTSVYVPGMVEPMLPEQLSNGVCSLVFGEDRFTFTTELELNGTKVERAAFYRSVIRSDVRLEYGQVDRIFAGKERPSGEWGPALAAAREIAAALNEERIAGGALELATAEPEFEFDDRGQVVAAHLEEQTESHRTIEALMVLANEQVAELLKLKRIPTLYRVHERPDPAQIEQLVAQLDSLGVPTPPLPERISSQQANDLVGQISQTVSKHLRRQPRGRPALESLVLRSLKKAVYSPKNIGHSGLRSACYCHFTSPIRRYPDTICHRALAAATGSESISLLRSADLDEAASWTSEREREAMEIERDADSIAACFLLIGELKELGENTEYEGEIVGLVGGGAFVRFGSIYEGFLPARKLRGEWWELNELGTALEGTSSGKRIRLGDPVTVAVERIEAARGRVDLDLA